MERNWKLLAEFLLSEMEVLYILLHLSRLAKDFQICCSYINIYIYSKIQLKYFSKLDNSYTDFYLAFLAFDIKFGQRELNCHLSKWCLSPAHGDS